MALYVFHVYVYLHMYSSVIVSGHPSAQLNSIIPDDMNIVIALLQSYWNVVSETVVSVLFLIHSRGTALIKECPYHSLCHR